jgi:signal transduction histidine kinase
MRVLIADDSMSVRAMLQTTLEEHGYEVVETKDGQQAWEALRDGDLRLAILDWVMPGMYGPEICLKLQEHKKLSLVYVILLTSKGGADNIAEALHAGASDYVTKPFQPDELIARLKVGERITRLQMQLAHMQKLESLGQLAAGIAHEINTPTQYVGDNLRFLQQAFDDLGRLLEKYTGLLRATKAGFVSAQIISELEAAAEEADVDYLSKEIPNAIQETLEGIERVSKIVRAMKDFSPCTDEEKKAINLNQAIENTITVAQNEWKYVAEVETDFDPSLTLVPCIPGDIKQVILHMIVNAAHAIDVVDGNGIGSKGIINIVTRRVGEWAEIRISDTGSGIPEHIKPRIFDPFFTTKEVGKGTGQGLAISHSIVVEKHCGTITVDSQIGRGTTFIIRLPMTG